MGELRQYCYCEDCNTFFISSRIFSKHDHNKNQNSKTYKCEFCIETFHTLADRKQHQHNSVNPLCKHECNEPSCKSTFLTIEEKNKHFEARHQANKDFQAKFKFTSNADLENGFSSEEILKLQEILSTSRGSLTDQEFEGIFMNLKYKHIIYNLGGEKSGCYKRSISLPRAEPAQRPA